MSDTPTVQFNINDYIRVKFSPASLRQWKERAEKMKAAFPKMSWPHEPPTDKAGYYRGQFWSIMHLVAPELNAGHSAFEDCLIEFETDALTREVELPPLDGEWDYKGDDPIWRVLFRWAKWAALCGKHEVSALFLRADGGGLHTLQKELTTEFNREVERRRDAEALVAELATALVDEGPDWSDEGLANLRRRVCLMFPGGYPYWEALLNLPYQPVERQGE